MLLMVAQLISIATSVPVPIAIPTSAAARGRGVVDAVADHRDPLALRLQLPDLAGLALGQHLSRHVRDAGLPGDHGGGVGVVAGEHVHFQAEPLQSRDCRCRSGLNGVSDGKHASGSTIDRDVYGGLTIVSLRLGGGPQLAEVGADVAEQQVSSHQDRASLDLAADSASGDQSEVLYRRQGQASSLSGGDDRRREGVLGAGFEGRHKLAHLLLHPARYGDPVGPHRLALGQGCPSCPAPLGPRTLFLGRTANQS